MNLRSLADMIMQATVHNHNETLHVHSSSYPSGYSPVPDGYKLDVLTWWFSQKTTRTK